jgi:predicted ribosomally synthesized peptide with SipW-like signal peptide
MDDRFDLTRRKALAAIGSIGVASAGAGLGTSAYFSDRETFENNRLTAGTLDMTVGWSEHYSDWSPDEGTGVAVRMYDGDGTGGPGDLADGETGLPANDAWLIAVDDPDRFLANTQTEAVDVAEAPCEGLDVPADLDEQEGARPVIDLADVKPGDFGEVTFDFALCDNPGYVWLNGSLNAASENGLTEPEADDEDEREGVVELLDEVRAAVWVDDGNDYQNGAESPVLVDSLRTVLATLGSGKGLELAGDTPAPRGGGTGRDCFAGTGDGEATLHSVAFAWWLPVDHANEIQTDGAEFDLGFYTEQCRHNDGVSDLAASYPFEGSVTDASGNGHDGTITNQGAYAPGPSGGRVLSLDGTDGYVRVPDADGLDGFDGITVAARMRLDDEGDVANTLVRKDGAYVLQRTSDDYVSFGVWDGSLADWRAVRTRAFDASDYGTWFHVVGVFDPDGQTYRLYLDGTEVDAASTSATAVDESAAPLTIGGHETQFSLAGAVDDVQLYSRALSGSEVQSLADST